MNDEEANNQRVEYQDNRATSGTAEEPVGASIFFGETTTSAGADGTANVNPATVVPANTLVTEPTQTTSVTMASAASTSEESSSGSGGITGGGYVVYGYTEEAQHRHDDRDLEEAHGHNAHEPNRGAYQDLKDPSTRPDHHTFDPTRFAAADEPAHPGSKYSFRVHNPQKQGDNALTAYVIYSVWSKSVANGSENTVSRRYSDFLWLHDQLQQEHRHIVIPPLPEKTLTRFSEPLVIYRMKELERFLYRVSSHKILSVNPKLDFFLTSTSTDFLAAKFPATRPMSQIGPQFINKTMKTWNFASNMFTSPPLPDTDPFFVNKGKHYSDLTSAVDSVILANQAALAKMSALQQSIVDYSTALSGLSKAQAPFNSSTSQNFMSTAESLTQISSCLNEMLGVQAAIMTDGMKDYTREIVEIEHVIANREEMLQRLREIAVEHASRKDRYEKLKTTTQAGNAKFTYDQIKEAQDKFQEDFNNFSAAAKYEIENTNAARAVEDHTLLKAFVKANLEYHNRCAATWRDLQHKVEATPLPPVDTLNTTEPLTEITLTIPSTAAAATTTTTTTTTTLTPDDPKHD
ncbi:vacuolar protein sorting-associated protein vps5 [Pelomyxa schiedti]|nr:vacuolar protein sorting-associated protein vps5 [Pelomyxa schiedti]